MLSARVKYLLWSLLLTSLILAVAGHLWSDRLLDRLVRPLAVEFAERRLGAEVDLRGLSFGDSGLILEGLVLDREDRYRAEILRIEIDFTLASLLHRRLTGLRVFAPRVEVAPTPAEDGEPPATALPPHPPLEIDRLQITDGDLTLILENNRLRLQKWQATADGTARSSFRAQGLLGDRQPLALSLRGTARWDQDLAVTLSGLRWNDRPLLGQPVTLTLGEATTAGGSVQIERFDDRELATLVGALGLQPPLPEGWRFELAGAEVGFALGDPGLNLSLRAQALTVRSAALTLPLEGLSLNLRGGSGSWAADGTFRLADAAAGTVTARYAEKALSGQVGLTIEKPNRLQRQILGEERLRLAGGATLQGDFTWSADGGRLRARGNGHEAGPGPAGWQVSLAPLSAVLEGRRQGQAVRADLRLEMDGKRLVRAVGSPDRIRLTLEPLAWGRLHQVLNPALLPAAIQDAERLTGTGELFLGPGDRWRFSGRLSAERLSLKQGALANPAILGAVAAVEGGFEADIDSFSAGVESPGLQAKQVSAGGVVRLRGPRFAVELSSVAAEGIEYLSADGMSGFSGGHFRGQGRLAGRLDEHRLDLEMAADLGAREVLSGAFYADFSDLLPRLTFAGELDWKDRVLQARTYTLGARELGMIRGAGSLGPARADLRADLTIYRLEGLFAKYQEALLAAFVPELKGLRLSGMLSADASLHWTAEGWRSAGAFRPADLGIAWPKLKIEGQGCSGLLPFNLFRGLGEAAGSTPEPHRGAFGCSAFKAGPAALGPAPIPITAEPNRFGLEQPLVFHLGGGRLEIDALEAFLPASGPELTARIQVRGVGLDLLTEAFGLTPMTGEIAADLGRIRYAEGELSTEGQAVIQAFGGTLRISGIRFREPFSSYPVLQGDLEFTGIDLLRLTHTFSFGEMNGIADGYVRQLRLFGKVPSRFVARFETRDSGTRNISVKALKNLSIISQGGLSGVLSQGIYRFIDFYRYRKIGIYCTLEKDVFRLEGVARPGSDRYLVYGSLLPPKIDIVAPARNISFKEMVKRISRIDRAGN